MPNTPRMKWPYPAENQDPWYDAFENLVTQQDASVYAAREDRHLIMAKGGLWGFNATSGLASWSDTFEILSPITGFRMEFAAGSVNVADGQVIYADLTRSPTTNTYAPLLVANQVPNTDSAFVVAVRRGATLFFRHGRALEDGDIADVFVPTSVFPVTIPGLLTSIWMGGRESHSDNVVPLVVGANSFTPTTYDPVESLVFSVEAANGTTGLTNVVQLWNVTDSELVAELEFTSTNVAKDEVVLVRGSGPGEIDDPEHIYEVRIKLGAAPAGQDDTIELYSAEIRVQCADVELVPPSGSAETLLTGINEQLATHTAQIAVLEDAIEDLGAAAIEDLQDALDAEIVARVAGDAAEVSARTAAINSEANTRAVADSAEVAARISAVASEAATRAAADSAEVAARIAAVSAEAALRIAGDTQAVGGDLAGNLPNPTVTGLTIAGQLQGDILYRGTSAWVRLPAGTSGDFLRTNGAGANPSWAPVSGGGGSTAGSLGNLINLRDYEAFKVGDNWTPAMEEALSDFAAASAAGDPCGGIHIPADPLPYKFEKPPLVGNVRPSIDLRAVSKCRLAGDGQGSVIQMAGDGGGGSWALIHIGGFNRDIVIENLVLDGDYTNLTNVDAGEQTHLIRLGTSNGVSGGTSNVRIQNCWLKNADGDAIAILPQSNVFGSGQEVSSIDIFHCDFINNQRNCISNQRLAQFIRIHFNWFELCADTDIDFEPTGDILGSGPRRYSIIGNQMYHTSGAASVTLSGIEGDIPSMDNIFAFNHIYGGRVGMVNVQGLLIDGNYIEGGPLITEPMLKINGKAFGTRASRNHIVRPKGSPPGLCVSVESDIRQPTFVGSITFTADNTTDLLTSAGHSLSTGDKVQLSSTGTLPAGLSSATDYFVRFVSSSTLKLATTLPNANNNITIDFTDDGTGTHTLTAQDYIVPSTDIIGFKNNGVEVGSVVRWTTTGTLPTGITAGTDYFTIPVGTETIKIATSYANAVANIPLDLTDRGTGVHTLTHNSYPRGMEMENNFIHTYVAANGDNCVVQFTNAIGCSFRFNDVANYSLGNITSAVKFTTTSSILFPVKDWSILHNRIRGSAKSFLTTFTAPIVSVDDTASTFVINGDPFSTGDEVQITTTGTQPGGLSLATNYYIIRVSANTYQLATGILNAMAGTFIDLTDAGTGTHTLTSLPSFTNAMMISPVGVAVSGIHIFDNICRNVTNRIYWNLGGGGSYADIPNVDRNSGDGVADFLFSNIAGKAIRTSGSEGGPAAYEGVGTPEANVVAAPGSTYRNRTAGDGVTPTSFWVKVSGTSTAGWVAVG